MHGVGSDLFPKIEPALHGKDIGDHVTVDLSPEDGFGKHNPGLTFTDDVDNVPPEYRHIGAQIKTENEKREAPAFVVRKIDNGKVTVDANDPRAGQTVRFDVAIQSIRDAIAEEIHNGCPVDGSAQVPLQ